MRKKQKVVCNNPELPDGDFNLLPIDLNDTIVPELEEIPNVITFGKIRGIGMFSRYQFSPYAQAWIVVPIPREGEFWTEDIDTQEEYDVGWKK